MGIYVEGEYQLARHPTNRGLYVRVTKNGYAHAVVRTPEPKILLEEFQYAWHLHTRGECGVWTNGTDVCAIVQRGYERVVSVRSAREGDIRAMVEANYLPLVSRLLVEDPARKYEPVRRLMVSSGQVWLRHHRREEKARATKREVAYRRIVQQAGEAIVVQLLTGEISA